MSGNEPEKYKIAAALCAKLRGTRQVPTITSFDRLSSSLKLRRTSRTDGVKTRF